MMHINILEFTHYFKAQSEARTLGVEVLWNNWPLELNPQTSGNIFRAV